MAVAKQTLNKKAGGLFKSEKKKDDHYDKIDWNDFNFPPFVNVYHFSMEEIKKEDKKYVSKLLITLLLTFLCLLVNLGFEMFFIFISEWTFK